MRTSKRAYNTHTQSKSWYFVVSILAIVFPKSKDDACLFSQLLVRSKQILLYCILMCCYFALFCFVLFPVNRSKITCDSHIIECFSVALWCDLEFVKWLFHLKKKWKHFSQDEIAIWTFIENGNFNGTITMLFDFVFFIGSKLHQLKWKCWI